MCGIAGFVGKPGSNDDRAALLRRMCDAIRHRGPDDDGYFVDSRAALGMRRLSIIDVAGGHQPISNENESLWIVFNGEIYNHHDLRDPLLKAGHRFSTRSDTEALVHLYEDRGTAMLQALRGMFAFAIWDARAQQLFLARDRLGIKPLYYWELPDGGLAFASELRAFIARDDFDRTVDARAVAEYLAFGYVPDPNAIFPRVRKLPPGHFLTWSPDVGTAVERYWTPIRDELPVRSADDAVDHLRFLLDDAVRYHLESEVPLGAFLSGGIDSSTVVAFMARAVDTPVQTFSIGFEEQAFNEAEHARAVAAALGTQHTDLIVRPSADVLFEHVVSAFDEPMSDPSALPTHLVSLLARQHVTVALSGDGGDEMFIGYSRYAEVLRRRHLGSSVVRTLLTRLARALPFVAPGRNRLFDLARSPEGRYVATVATPLNVDLGGIAREQVAALLGTYERLLEPWFAMSASRDFATQLSMVDTLTYLPGDILTKVDRMSMATSLEARVPLLDHTVAEYALSLPSQLKLRDGTGKWILRRAVEAVVPPLVLERRKHGFGIPLPRWFRNELRHRVDALRSPGERLLTYVDRSAVARIVAEHLIGRRDHSRMLWRLLVLDGWLNMLADGRLGRPTEPNPGALSIVDTATVY